jgi:hypothetical protein
MPRIRLHEAHDGSSARMSRVTRHAAEPVLLCLAYLDPPFAQRA